MTKIEELQAEVVRLTADVAFKDSLIWTSRESELYKATVVAEKAAKKAEARVASLEAALRDIHTLKISSADSFTVLTRALQIVDAALAAGGTE